MTDYPLGADVYPFSAALNAQIHVAAAELARLRVAAVELARLRSSAQHSQNASHDISARPHCSSASAAHSNAASLARQLLQARLLRGFGGLSMPAFEGVGRQLAELFAVVVGEPPQVKKAIIHGHFRNVAHVAGRITQAQVDAFEFLLPDVVLR